MTKGRNRQRQTLAVVHDSLMASPGKDDAGEFHKFRSMEYRYSGRPDNMTPEVFTPCAP